MEEKKTWDVVKYAGSMTSGEQRKQTIGQRLLREEIDRQLGRHLIDAQRKELDKRGIK